VEALTDTAGKEANTAREEEEMLRCDSFPPNHNDQYSELLPAGSTHMSLTEQAVE